MQYRVTVDVRDEPVTLAEARLQCKVDSDDQTHDMRLAQLITEAREFGEHATGRGFARRTIEVALDCFPAYEDDTITLPLAPVASITSVKYTDLNGTEQTIAGSAYALSPYGDSNRIAPTYGNYWPSTQSIRDAVRIVCVCGHESAPKAAKGAMLLHVEANFPLNDLTPAERADIERARNSLLNTLKVYGR